MILDVKFSKQQETIRFFDTSAETVQLAFGQVVEVNRGAAPYTGDYAVTPSVEGSIMATKDKYMTQNVTVRPIPYYNVSNTAGGTTVYIAKEI